MQERLHYLFERYLDNQCSRKELDELFEFIRQAEDDQVLRQMIRDTYHSIEKDLPSFTLVDENGQLILDNSDDLQPTLTVGRSRKRPALLAVAASVMLLLACSVWFILKNKRASQVSNNIATITKKTTDRSESKFLLLEDSTKVWLNSASSLEFPDEFNNGKREVYLSGEAYFEVKHADKVPFIIHTGNVLTTVLGTSFNIKAYPGQKDVIVSVSTGKVKLSRKNVLVTTLTNGQKARIEDEGVGIVEKTVPAFEVAAWQQGIIVFDDETFEDITADLERVYNTTINIQNDSIRGLKISTSFKKEIGVEQALQVLCKLTDSEMAMKDGVYVLK